MSAKRLRPGQKRSGKKKPKSSVLNGEIISQVRRQIDDRWPNLGRRLVSLIQISREKLDDIYSSAAEAINEHKEAFEDRRAERKARTLAEARAARQSDFKALPPPQEVQGSGKRATGNGSGLSSPGKKSDSILSEDTFLN
jgi:hypothetical protein